LRIDRRFFFVAYKPSSLLIETLFFTRCKFLNVACKENLRGEKSTDLAIEFDRKIGIGKVEKLAFFVHWLFGKQLWVLLH